MHIVAPDTTPTKIATWLPVKPNMYPVSLHILPMYSSFVDQSAMCPRGQDSTQTPRCRRTAHLAQIWPLHLTHPSCPSEHPATKGTRTQSFSLTHTKTLVYSLWQYNNSCGIFLIFITSWKKQKYNYFILKPKTNTARASALLNLTVQFWYKQQNLLAASLLHISYYSSSSSILGSHSKSFVCVWRLTLSRATVENMHYVVY